MLRRSWVNTSADAVPGLKGRGSGLGKRKLQVPPPGAYAFLLGISEAGRNESAE